MRSDNGAIFEHCDDGFDLFSERAARVTELKAKCAARLSTRPGTL